MLACSYPRRLLVSGRVLLWRRLLRLWWRRLLLYGLRRWLLVLWRWHRALGGNFGALEVERSRTRSGALREIRGWRCSGLELVVV